MHENKVQKHYYLKERTIEYIEKYKELNKVPTLSGALDNIIEEHRNISKEKIDSAYEILSRDISEQIKSCFEGELKKIKFSSRSSDKNSQIILELLNCILANNLEYKDLLISDFKSPVVKKAEKEVENEIMRKHYKNSGSRK